MFVPRSRDGVCVLVRRSIRLRHREGLTFCARIVEQTRQSAFLCAESRRVVLKGAADARCPV